MPPTTKPVAEPTAAASRTALLLIDVINEMRFEGAERLVRSALRMTVPLRRLKSRAKAAGCPVIYVNDNFGQWRSDFRRLVEHCTTADVPGRPVAERLRPDEDDYFVLKPKHSAFFGTTLDTLLEQLRVERLILTGVAANICVLFTAHDAHMRGYRLHVPEDCVASNTRRETQHALEHLRTVMAAVTAPSSRLSLTRRREGRLATRRVRRRK
jgi:nicotinamidase-related amidase